MSESPLHFGTALLFMETIYSKAGGGMGAHSRLGDTLLDWSPATDIIRIAEAARWLFDQLGDRSRRHRARLRDLFERIGDLAAEFSRESGVRTTVGQNLLPAHLTQQQLVAVRFPLGRLTKPHVCEMAATLGFGDLADPPKVRIFSAAPTTPRSFRIGWSSPAPSWTGGERCWAGTRALYTTPLASRKDEAETWTHSA